jgi:hypothetical protein
MEKNDMSQSGPAASFRCLLTVVVMTLTVGNSPVNASETASQSVVAPEDLYRVLEWQDLVPDGWEPPLVARAYDEAAEAFVDESSVVQGLHGQLAALPGYMKPVVFEGNQVSEFLLVPFLPHQIRAHAHLEPNQMVYVYALEPVVVEQPLEPLWIVGTLSLEQVMTDEGPAAYRMIDAVTTRYEH